MWGLVQVFIIVLFVTPVKTEVVVHGCIVNEPKEGIHVWVFVRLLNICSTVGCGEVRTALIALYISVDTIKQRWELLANRFYTRQLHILIFKTRADGFAE